VAVGVIKAELKPFYPSSLAIVIGINRYEEHDSLACAVNDADRFATLLIETLKFPPERVRALLDPPPTHRLNYQLHSETATREALEDLLFSQLSHVGRDDRLVVFYAGHALSLPAPAGGRPLGYLLPADAKRDQLQTMLAMARVTSELSRVVPAKHALFLLDCCYSGLAGTRDAASPPPYTEAMITRWCRQLLTAGTEEQVVQDEYKDGNSLFTYHLLEGLRGSADVNADGVITASELVVYVKNALGGRAYGRQSPELLPLDDHQSGAEFVFHVDPVEFKADSVPSLVLDGRRRPLQAPRFTHIEERALALSTARAEIEASLRELALLSNVKEYRGALDSVTAALENATVLPPGTAIGTVEFVHNLDKVLYRSRESDVARRMLEAARYVILDLEELKARMQEGSVPISSDQESVEAPRAEDDGDKQGSTLQDALRTYARLDDLGLPIFALARVGETADWVDVAVGEDLQPLLLPTSNKEDSTERVVIASTPPGVELGGLLALPADEWGQPRMAFRHLVMGIDEIPVTRATEGPASNVSFVEAMSAVIARAREQGGGYRWRFLRSATGEKVQVLIGVDGRPVRFWYKPAEFGWDEAGSVTLACLVGTNEGIIAVALDEMLRPVRADMTDQPVPPEKAN
jgi:hypothetical protein